MSTLKISVWLGVFMLQNLETALAGGLEQMSLVKWLPDVSTQSRVFISDNEIQGMVTYIPVGGGAGEMAVGGKLKAWVVTWVMGGAVNK